jgi:Flp pilus assembly protein TadD
MANTNPAPDTLKRVIEGQTGLNEFFGLPGDQIEALAALGSRLYEQGKARDAATIFDGLIALDPKSHYGYAGLGAISLREEKLDDAIGYLRRAATLNTKDPTVHANLGEALLRQAKFNDAATEFDQAMKLDPQERDPGANRARAILQGMNVVIHEVQRVGVA